MQTEDLLQQDVFDTNITEESSNHLAGISLWMQLNAITAFVALAVTIASTIWLYMRFSSFGFGSSAFGGGTGILRFLLTTAVTLVMNILLLQASSNIKKGLAAQDQQHFNLGMQKMAIYFKTMGILIIVGLSLMLLFFFFALAFSAFR
jgi:Family of unknown function (DUF5362)